MRSRAVVAAALSVLALVPAEASAGTATCLPRGAESVASNRYVRVFTVESRRADYGAILYACWRSTGRRIRLAEQFDDGLYESTDFSKVTLNRGFVAWEAQSTDVSCKADCPADYNPTTTSIEVADVRRRRGREYPGAVRDVLVVSRKGTPAWLQDTGGGTVEVRAARSVLDTGAIDSLELDSTTLSWVNAGQPKTAALP